MNSDKTKKYILKYNNGIKVKIRKRDTYLLYGGDGTMVDPSVNAKLDDVYKLAQQMEKELEILQQKQNEVQVQVEKMEQAKKENITANEIYGNTVVNIEDEAKEIEDNYKQVDTDEFDEIHKSLEYHFGPGYNLMMNITQLVYSFESFVDNIQHKVTNIDKYIENINNSKDRIIELMNDNDSKKRDILKFKMFFSRFVDQMNNSLEKINNKSIYVTINDDIIDINKTIINNVIQTINKYYGGGPKIDIVDNTFVISGKYENKNIE